MIDDLGMADFTTNDQVRRLSVSHQSLASSRSASQQLIESVETRIAPRDSIEGFDKPDPVLIGVMRNLSEDFEKDLLKVSTDDPTAENKKKEIELRYSQERFRLSRKYNAQNEAKPKQ